MKVHITQGDHEGNAVIVSWITPDEPGSNTVLYWADNSKLKTSANGIILTYKNFKYTSGYIHYCAIKNLAVHASFYLKALINFHGLKLLKQNLNLWNLTTELLSMQFDTKYYYEVGIGNITLQFWFVTPPRAVVTPCPDEVHSTCNCRGTYVHQVPL